jgi:hypothetical protein
MWGDLSDCLLRVGYEVFPFAVLLWFIVMLMLWCSSTKL